MPSIKLKTGCLFHTLLWDWTWAVHIFPVSLFINRHTNTNLVQIYCSKKNKKQINTIKKHFEKIEVNQCLSLDFLSILIIRIFPSSNPLDINQPIFLVYLIGFMLHWCILRHRNREDTKMFPLFFFLRLEVHGKSLARTSHSINICRISLVLVEKY